MKVGEYYSDDTHRYSAVYTRGSGFRVFFLNSYFDTQEEKYVERLEDAENLAENFVMYQDLNEYK